MPNSDDAYTFGHSQHELDRLLRQGALYAPITREVFTRAGIAAGMRVVDLGCGAGDVTLLLAEMVGPQGHVLAVDRAPEAIATTQRRASDAGVAHVSTRRCELGDLSFTEPFDAAAGRLVLAYVPQRVALLRKLAASLAPGGILAFVEMDLSISKSQPPSDLARQAGKWVYDAMTRGGFEPEMGSRLFAAFNEVGLRAELAAFNIVDGGPNSIFIDYLGDVIESILPMIERLGVATRDEADPQRLVRGMRAESGVDGRAFYLPRLTGAWTRTAQ